MPMRLHRRDEGHVNWGVALVQAIEHAAGAAEKTHTTPCLKDVMLRLHAPPARTNLRRPLLKPDDWVYAIRHTARRYPQLVAALWQEAAQSHSEIVTLQMRRQLADIDLPSVPAAQCQR